MTWLSGTAWPLVEQSMALVATYITTTFVPVMSMLWTWLSPLLQGALGWLSTTGLPMLQGAMAAYTDWVTTTAIPVIALVWDWFSTHWQPVMEWMTTTGWPAVLAAMGAVATWVTGTYIPTLSSLWSWLSDKLGAVLTWFTQTGWPAMGNAANAVQNWIKETLIPTLSDWYSWLQDRLSPIYTWFITYGWPQLQAAGTAVWTWLTSSLFPTLSEWYVWFQERLSPVYTWFITYGWPKLQEAGAAVWSWITSSLLPTLHDWWDVLQNSLSPVYTWFITYGWPKMKDGANDTAGAIQGLTGWFNALQGELAKTDTAESWVTILENLAKFGHYIVTSIDLAGWFKQVGSGAGEAGDQVGYIAQAIAWISRTLAKWSSYLPGAQEPPKFDEPPSRPGSSGGDGGGLTGGEAPPSRSVTPSPSSGGGGGSTPAPAPAPPSGGGGGGGGGSTPAPAPSPSPSPSPSPTEPFPGYPFTEVYGGDGTVRAYIKQAASARGIDPGIAIRVADSEGGSDDPMRIGRFKTGWSFWPFQLHYGGANTPYAMFGDTAGMGNSFTANRNYEPGDPNAWKPSTDYALDVARSDGWKQWYGAAAVGIGRWDGIPGHATGGWVGLHGPEMAVLGERGPEYVIPNNRLGGGSGGHQTMTLNVAIGGRVAEQIVVEGYELAVRRGRLAGIA